MADIQITEAERGVLADAFREQWASAVDDEGDADFIRTDGDVGEVADEYAGYVVAAVERIIAARTTALRAQICAELRGFDGEPGNSGEFIAVNEAQEIARTATPTPVASATDTTGAGA